MPRRFKTPPVATIGDIHRAPGWFWVTCARTGCGHYVPMAIAPFRIRWGANASTDMIRQNLRCSRCGFRGVNLSHPSWSSGTRTGTEFGDFGPMPVDMMPGGRLYRA